MIQANKRLDSYGISAKELVGTLKKSDVGKLKGSVDKTPEQYCQTWVVGVLEDLEGKGLVAEGTAAQYEARVEERPRRGPPRTAKNVKKS